MARPASFDYVTVGHVTRDVIDGSGVRGGQGRSQPGGGAFYSALQAARLGLRTMIVTQGVPHEIETLLSPYAGELELQVTPAGQTTTLATSGSGSSRTQRLLAWAGPMVEEIAVDAGIAHLASVARETPARLAGRCDFLGMTPQGLLRAWPDPQAGSEAAISWARLDPSLLPERFHAAVISEGESTGSAELFAAARRSGALVAVTAGARPTTVHAPDGILGRTPPPPSLGTRDDLGAGDAFAAAFFCSLATGEAPLRAAAFANAAAAARVAGIGPDALAGRDRIEAILRQAPT